MNNNELWFAELSGLILTHFKTRLKKLIPDGQFRKLKITTSNSDIAPTELPTIWLEEVSSMETGENLDNTSINAVIETIQVTVFYNGQMKDVKKLMNASVLAMKQMRFGAIMTPIYTTTHEMKTGVARFRRLIGEGDSF